jgi:cytochrome c biogenesis protein
MIPLAGTETEVQFYRYIPSFDERASADTGALRPDNPRVVYLVYEGGEAVSMGLAKPGETAEITEGKNLRFERVDMYTVLRLKTDPGLRPAALGAVMLMLGVCWSVAAGNKAALPFGAPG